MTKKQTALNALVLSIAACALMACSVEDKSSSLKYSFSENGCETGEKSFSNLETLCVTIQDDSANNYCAGSLRYQYYKEKCESKAALYSENFTSEYQ